MSIIYNRQEQDLLEGLLNKTPTRKQCDYIKDCMVRHLIDTGYPDYAAILYRLDFRLLFRDYIAYIDQSTTYGTNITMGVNSRAFVTTNTNGVYYLRADWKDVVSLLMRHEILHRLLKHAARERKLRESHKRVDANALRYAKDIEVSNYYSFDDVVTWNRNPDIFFGGLVVYPEFNTAPQAMFPQYQGKPFEKVYEMLLADMEQSGGDGDGDQKDQQKQKQKKQSNAGGLGDKDGEQDSKQEESEQQSGTDKSNQSQKEKQKQKNQPGQGDSDEQEPEQEPGDEQDEQGDENSDEQESEEEQRDSDESEPEIETKYNPAALEQLENLQNSHQSGSDELPMQENVQEQMRETVEMRKADTQSQIQGSRGGPGDYAACDNTYVAKEDRDREIMQSSLHYDLNMYFGGASRYNRHGTFARPNRKYGDTDIIRKSRIMRPKDESRLALYVDRSGSFDDGKTIAAESVFEKLRQIRNLDLEVFYFATSVVTEEEYKNRRRSPGGGTSYEAVFQHMAEHDFRNVAIISDDDSYYGGAHFPKCVESVWYCYVRRVDNRSSGNDIVKVDNTDLCVPPCLLSGLHGVKPSVRVAVWTVDVVWAGGKTCGVVNRAGVTTVEHWREDIMPALKQRLFYDTAAIKE